jgi:hypothetical protein
MNIALERRLKRVEEKIAPPRLSPEEAKLCEQPDFRRVVAGMGVDVDKAIRTGDLLGQFPRDVLRQMVERLRAMNSAR